MNEKKIPFWHMHGSAKIDQYMISLMNRKPPRFKLINKLELFDIFEGGNILYGDGPEKINKINSPIVAAFNVTAEDYHPSIIPLNIANLYSSELISTLDLNDDVIQYFDIDSSKCAKPFKDKNYKLAHILTIGDVIDLEASGFEPYNEPSKDGAVIQKWRYKTLPPTEREPLRFQTVHFKFLTTPPASPSIFRARWGGQVMVSDDMADKIIQSGLKDIHFQDITFIDPEQKNVRLKTLNGIEIVDYREYSKLN